MTPGVTRNRCDATFGMSAYARAYEIIRELRLHQFRVTAAVRP